MNRHDAALSGLATSTATSTEAPLAGYLLQRSESLDSVVAAETGSGGSLAALTATMNASDSAAAGQVAATDEGLNIGLNDQSLSQTLADDQTQLTYVTTIAGDELNYVQALAPVAVNFQVASAEAEIVSAENGGDGGGDSPDSPAAVYAASALAAITGPVTQAADDNWNALNAAAEENNAFASAATSALQQATTSETGSLAADLSADDAAGLSAIQADASAAAAAIEGVSPTSVWSAGESSIVAAVNSTVGLDVSQATGSLQKEVASLESEGASGVRGLAALLAGSTAASADLMSAASAAQATSLGALTDSDATPWTPTLLSPPALPGLTGETYPGGEFGGDFGKLKFVNDGYYTSFLAPMDANLSGQSGDPDAGEYVDDFTSGGESLSNDYDSNPYDANDTDTNSNDMIVDMRFDSFDAYGAWGFGVAQAQNDFANIQQPFYSSVSLPTPSIANPPASASTAAYSDGVTTQSIDGYRDSLFTQTGPTGFWMTSGADSVAPTLDSSSDSSDSANVPGDLDVGDFALSAVTPTDSPISTANDWSGLDTAAQTQAGPTVETTLDAFATSVASGTSGSGDSSDSTDTAAGGELDDFDFQNPNQAAAHLQASSLAPTNPFSEFGATGAPNNGVSATYTTNSLGQLTEEQDPNGQTIDYTYNSAGQVLTETDVDSDDSANATETENVYNAAGQLASQSQVSGGQTRTTSYDYNSSGSVTQETDPDGKVTVFTYGAANQVTSETWYPSADAEAVGLTDATDQFIYTYNAAGELTSATDDQSSYTFTYDGYGRLLTVDNAGTPGAPPVVETYAYDPGNSSPSAQPISLTATDGDGHEYFENLYTYDASGDETSVTQIVPGETDKSALFKYYSPGQLSEVDRYMSDLPTGAIDSDDSGEFEVPTTATPALVAKSVYSYDDHGNLTSIDNTTSAGATIDDFSWTYDDGPGLPSSGDSAEPLSNTGDSLPLANAATIPGGSSLPAWEVSSFTSSVDGTASYSYDDDAQLLGASYTGAQPGETYTYDDAGNRTNVGGAATVVGPFNEVLNDGTYCYCYDADGDLIRETSIATGAYTTFAYDNRNRMTSADLFNASGVETEAIAYTYDVFNNMIARTETDYTCGVAGTPTTQEFVYAGPQSNGQMALTFQTSGAAAPTMSNVTDRYLWGPAVDQILADDRTGSVAADAILWTIDDNQNTVRDVVDSSGNVLDHITYSSFGVPLSHSALNPAAVDPIFGYTGAYTDPTTGLQNHVDRVYDPLAAIWTTSDPAAPDVNSGRYVGNSPTNGTDPTGLAWVVRTDNYGFEVKLPEYLAAEWDLIEDEVDDLRLSGDEADDYVDGRQREISNKVYVFGKAREGTRLEGFADGVGETVVHTAPYIVGGIALIAVASFVGTPAAGLAVGVFLFSASASYSVSRRYVGEGQPLGASVMGGAADFTGYNGLHVYLTDRDFGTGEALHLTPYQAAHGLGSGSVNATLLALGGYQGARAFVRSGALRGLAAPGTRGVLVGELSAAYRNPNTGELFASVDEMIASFRAQQLINQGRLLEAPNNVSFGTSLVGRSTGSGIGAHTLISHNLNQFVYRAMSNKEFARVQLSQGLIGRSAGSRELGITLNAEYSANLLKGPKYDVVVEIEVAPGTWDALLGRSAAHPSASELFPTLPRFEKGMQVPQVKIERGGVVSILLGSSEDAIREFNARIVRIRVE